MSEKPSGSRSDRALKRGRKSLAKNGRATGSSCSGRPTSKERRVRPLSSYSNAQVAVALVVAVLTSLVVGLVAMVFLLACHSGVKATVIGGSTAFLAVLTICIAVVGLFR